MTDIAKIIGAFLAAIAVAAVLFFGTHLILRATADFRGDTDRIEQTRASGSFRIAAYDEFFDLCSSIQSLEDRIDALEESTSDRAAQDLLAVEARRSQLIREYNANANRDWTVGQFQAESLPYQIQIQGDTECN